MSRTGTTKNKMIKIVNKGLGLPIVISSIFPLSIVLMLMVSKD